MCHMHGRVWVGADEETLKQSTHPMMGGGGGQGDWEGSISAINSDLPFFDKSGPSVITVIPVRG